MKEKIYSTDPSKIFVDPNRQRQLFNRKGMAELINSIKDLGLIQPVICRKNKEDQIELVVGERRLRACEEIGINLQFILIEEIEEPTFLERVQLEENLVREDLEWKEEVRAKKRIFDILKASDSRQTVETVGNYLGVGKGTLSEDISLAIWIEENEEVAGAPNKTTAKKIAKRLFVVTKRDEALEESIEKSKAKTVKILRDGMSKEGMSEKEIDSQIQVQASKESILSLEESRILLYDSQCILGKMEEKLLDFPNKHFDLVFFDPPWGVKYDQSQKDAKSQKKYEDSEKSFIESFPQQLKLLYEKMSEDSHIYIFFGIVNHNFVYDCIEAAEFKTSRIPLIWHKLGACRTRAPEWEYGRSYEPIAFARKGTKKLNFPPLGNVIPTSQPTTSLKDIHPSAKHPEIYRKLLLQSGFPGDKVLDPMAGSGMMAVAAENLRGKLDLDWTQIEMDEDYRNLEVFNLTKGYDQLTRNQPSESSESSSEERAEAWVKAHPKQEIAKDYHTLEPGSVEWKDFWNQHPEKQKEMLKWREQKGD